MLVNLKSVLSLVCQNIMKGESRDKRKHRIQIWLCRTFFLYEKYGGNGALRHGNKKSLFFLKKKLIFFVEFNDLLIRLLLKCTKNLLKKCAAKICRFKKSSYLCNAIGKTIAQKQRIGRLAQLVQSICLTSRGSAVRIRQRPRKRGRKLIAAFFHFARLGVFGAALERVNVKI